ncbi:MAG: aminoacyl-tRNA hydrolase [Candidatus Portnoybacteria bacterium RIFCSPHIGHO2_02_FULL_40_23]|uniref:Peptidyl-tRNA hydrolase n=1 Tax=Candidatus Portnoybacteria bacterium RIFCSPHIGHO2_01_FULL_40_12b TaxID=1801994 RepID=A0A1G2FAW3_9BACT|nr:MAG: aminoacyl-tRNA hydrolase [Candidatus Portnoybacteria bacterium RIFCSPHIGHO2_01_FULL_40_12b]OGZ36915.1 MAG: aminoacyl-tRNA hydrolase [Candidatus Portnoybacteria bacterium RIFCSPHIGHO2_02_FULL_40_23]
MKLVIGLGNPGNKYEKTRHNLGFLAIDELRRNLKFGIWNLDKKFKSLISKKSFNNQKVILAKPQTYMNNSGEAVKLMLDYYKINLGNLFIVHDDIDLPLGKILVQEERGSAGHNGVQSVIDALKTKDFTRIRMGIKPKNSREKLDTEKFVLERFSGEEEKIIQETIKKAGQIIMAAI